jgi:hypothetical protein
MASVTVRINAEGLLNYSKSGLEAFKEVKKTTGKIMNAARKEVRQRISSEFQRRTGFLNRQARRVRTKNFVGQAEIYGRVSPIPRLMNIFEYGATLSSGRGYLRPRPVVRPAGDVMERQAPEAFERIVRQIGK